MSNILVVTGVVEGHFYPASKIVEELINRGHKILWWSGECQKHRIESIGAQHKQISEKYDPKGKPFYEFRPEIAKLKGIKQFKFYAKKEFLDLSEHVLEMYNDIKDDFSIDLVLSDPVIWPIYFLAEKLDIPSVNLHMLPLLVNSQDTAPFGTGLRPATSGVRKFRNSILNFVANEILMKDVLHYANDKRKLFGLQPFDKKHRFICNAMLAMANRVLYMTVPSFDYPRTDLPIDIEFIGPILREHDNTYVQPEWWSQLSLEKPVILVNQGTMISDPMELIYPTIEGLKNEDYIVIALPLEKSDKLLPENVYAESFIPFGNILPFVDVFITNAGYGGTHMALAQGIPIIAAGEQDDKMEIAARISWSGCGINLGTATPKPRMIREAVKKVLLDSTFKTNAARIQNEIYLSDTVNRACNVIEETLI